MSEINTIKPTNHLGVSSNKHLKADGNTGGEQSQSPQATEQALDKVSLTHTATQLQSLQQHLADTPVVDNNRVSAIKAAIAEGSYDVDPAELASNMSNFEQQFS